jgi:two-component system chemotaxis response regulator CheB
MVVVGASAGGMEALTALVSRVPHDLQASIFVVWHMAPDSLYSGLPRMLERVGPLTARLAEDRERIEAGRIYVAPPDHHLLLEAGYVRVAKGPKENRFRPAVDPLFRSAAYVYGARVIGVVLSGALDDGTSGLWTIKLRGGTTIVQDPGEALSTSMPLTALRSVEVDHCLPAADIGPLLARLTQEEAPIAPRLSMDKHQRMNTEARIAAGDTGWNEAP